MKTLRIIFAILCAVCLASLYPVGVFLDLPYVLGVVAIGGISFMLMLWCKHKQEMAEQQNEPTPPVGDFFHPIKKAENPNTPATPADNAGNPPADNTKMEEPKQNDYRRRFPTLIFS